MTARRSAHMESDMTDKMTLLAKRAVACKGWRWMPGMLSDEGRVVEINVYGVLVGYTTGIILKSGAQGWPRAWEASASLRLPDLSDPATLGCLLALVRKAWGDPGMFVRPRGSKMRPDWAVFTGQNSDLVCSASKEVEALVAALEAAPNTGGEHCREEGA